MQQDEKDAIVNGLQFSYGQLITGAKYKSYPNTHFSRFNEYIEEYPDFHDDFDDYNMYETDDFERTKMFQPKDEHTVGLSPVIPYDDNDEVYHFYDIQGESVYSNPPDSNMLTIDHGLEEDHVWAFRLNTYGDKVVANGYKNDPYRATESSYAPFWGMKLATPSFHREEKVQKFLKHWDYRKGLEVIKAKHAIEAVADPIYSNSVKGKQDAADEISAYIASVQKDILKEGFKDVYTTDHVPKP